MTTIDRLIRDYKLATKAWVRARVNVFDIFSFHPGAMKRFLSTLATVCAMVVMLGCVGLLIAMAAAPERPLTHNQQQFVAFANAHAKAYDNYRIAQFENEVKGEFVQWEGTTCGIDPRGDALTVIPHPTAPRWQNGKSRIDVYVVLEKGFVPSNFQAHGTKVRVIGRIRTVSVGGCIVRGKIEAL